LRTDAVWTLRRDPNLAGRNVSELGRSTREHDSARRQDLDLSADRLNVLRHVRRHQYRPLMAEVADHFQESSVLLWVEPDSGFVE
jgi:hypothetical protein